MVTDQLITMKRVQEFVMDGELTKRYSVQVLQIEAVHVLSVAQIVYVNCGIVHCLAWHFIYR